MWLVCDEVSGWRGRSLAPQGFRFSPSHLASPRAEHCHTKEEKGGDFA